MPNILSKNVGSPREQLRLCTQSDVDWTDTECLFIQLYFELVLAVARSSSAPIVFQNVASSHKNFLRYFSFNPIEYDGAAGERNSVIRALEEFVDKRNELVPGVIAEIEKLMRVRIKESNTPIINGVKITLSMLEEYRKIREDVGHRKDMPDPRNNSMLRNFLESAAEFQILQMIHVKTWVPNVNDKDTENALGDSNDLTPTVQAQYSRDEGNTGAEVSEHGKIQREAGSSIESTSVTLQSHPQDASGELFQNNENIEDATRPEQEPAIASGASAPSKARCTVVIEKTGKQCNRPRPATVPEDEHDTWMCHIHQGQLKSNVKPGSKRIRRTTATSK
ncbi:hypothetical protein BKA66DRAFT_441178 [Pyrenochaeta sp. MPI-SDFR-AT-0127]|nr:hypothetical protein BKA66DRAFT_441178 [Pyrenochaeta sp. MPI-SDFR-AT-0127]